jgi:hypothetical protein
MKRPNESNGRLVQVTVLFFFFDLSLFFVCRFAGCVASEGEYRRIFITYQNVLRL